MTDQAYKLIALIWVSVFAVAIIAFPFILRHNKLKESGQINVVKAKKMQNRFQKYKRNVFLRKRFNLIEKQYSILMCYDRTTVQIKCVEVFESALKVSIGIPVIVGLLMRDILMFATVLLVGYIYYDIAINKEYDRINKQIHEEAAICIQSIRDKYTECDNIPTAVLNSDTGKLLERPINEIYEILTDKDGERRLYQFCALSPIRIIKTLATTCFIVNETGDIKSKADGSAFSNDMISLRQETDAEIRRLEQIRIAFKSLPFIALIGLFILPLEEWYLLSQIPGTSTLIKGTYGIICKIIIVISTAVVYYVISVIMRPSVVNQSDRGQFIDSLLLRKKFKLFIKDIMPKKQMKLDKVANMINGALSQKDIYFIYASKVLYSSIAFVSGLLFAIVFIITTRGYIYTNYAPLNFSKQAPIKAEIHELIVKMDAEYLEFEEPLDDDDLLKFVKGKLRGMQELEYMNQRDRVQTKYTIYHNMTWKWQWGILSIVCAMICWYIPDFTLMFRKKMVEFEAEEDIMQLQTMMIVLSGTDMDVFKAIYWLERQSSIHKEALRYCYHEYTSDPELALKHLSEKTNNVEFKKIINKLLSASFTLSLADAFSDMKLDKQQFMFLREMRQTEQRESKRQNAKLACVVPGGVALIFMFVAPILILGITQLTGSLGSLTSL